MQKMCLHARVVRAVKIKGDKNHQRNIIGGSSDNLGHHESEEQMARSLEHSALTSSM